MRKCCCTLLQRNTNQTQIYFQAQRSCESSRLPIFWAFFQTQQATSVIALVTQKCLITPLFANIWTCSLLSFNKRKPQIDFISFFIFFYCADIIRDKAAYHCISVAQKHQAAIRMPLRDVEIQVQRKKWTLSNLSCTFDDFPLAALRLGTCLLKFN